jgi:hypothetical protein
MAANLERVFTCVILLFRVPEALALVDDGSCVVTSAGALMHSDEKVTRMNDQ